MSTVKSLFVTALLVAPLIFLAACSGDAGGGPGPERKLLDTVNGACAQHNGVQNVSNYTDYYRTFNVTCKDGTYHLVEVK